MNVIVYDQDPVFLTWANEQLHASFDPALVRTISHVRKNGDDTWAILGVAIFHSWTEHACEMSVVSSTPDFATRRFVAAWYDYAFNHAGKERLTTIVAADNTHSVHMQGRLGHKYEGQLDDYYGANRPGLIFGMTKRSYLQSRWAPRTKTTNEGNADEL